MESGATGGTIVASVAVKAQARLCQEAAAIYAKADGTGRRTMDEVEIKFRLAGPQEHVRLRAALTALGATAHGGEHEQNLLFDDAIGSLGSNGTLLRLRVLDSGPRARLTYKGQARYDGAIKRREEIEVGIDDGTTMAHLLEALGLQQALTYEKQRETWRLPGIEVALDTLAFGHFCEIEGDAAAIRDLCARLSLDERQAETAGYPTMARAMQGQGTANRE